MPYHRGFDSTCLIANRRTGGLAVCADDDFAGARPEAIRHDHYILRRFAIQIVGMNNQKTDAFEVRRLLR